MSVWNALLNILLQMNDNRYYVNINITIEAIKATKNPNRKIDIIIANKTIGIKSINFMILLINRGSLV